MTIGLVGRKCGMTRVFTDEGAAVPVTVIEVLPNRVTRVLSQDQDGYAAVQVTTGQQEPFPPEQVGGWQLCQGRRRDGRGPVGIPGQRRRIGGPAARRRAEGRSFPAGPVRGCRRHHHRQGLRRRHQAAPFRLTGRHPRQLAVPSGAGLHRTAPVSRPRVSGQAHGRPSWRRQSDHPEPGSHPCGCGPQPDAGARARCPGIATAAWW